MKLNRMKLFIILTAFLVVSFIAMIPNISKAEETPVHNPQVLENRFGMQFEGTSEIPKTTFCQPIKD